MEVPNVLLKMQKITKSFPGVTALKDVDFDLKEGEVHIILGENGAGKSTLMKILAGAYSLDEGKILISGKEAEIHNPKQAQNLGVGIIYQEFNLVPYMNVAENIFIDDFPRNKFGFIDHKKMHKNAREILSGMNMKVDTHRQIVEISTAQQQMVEVAKTMKHNSKILCCKCGR